MYYDTIYMYIYIYHDQYCVNTLCKYAHGYSGCTREKKHRYDVPHCSLFHFIRGVLRISFSVAHICLII